MPKQFTARLIFANDIPVDHAQVSIFDGIPGTASAQNLTIGECNSDSSGIFTVQYLDPQETPYLFFKYQARDHEYTYVRKLRQAPAELRLPENQWLEFKPSEFGFKFRNNFPPFDLPDGLQRLLSLPIVSENYGLCGGMSSGAYDCYLSGRRPQAEDVPEAGSPLHLYLFKRAMNTFGLFGENLLQVAKWTRTPDHNPNSPPILTRREWETIKRELDAEKAVVLTLIYKYAKNNKELFNVIWDNHQVLAYGYTPRSDGAVDIHIYDSNFPSDDNVIVQAKRVFLNTDQGIQEGLSCEQIIPGRQPKPVRGFFAMDYEKKEPPPEL